MGYLAVIDLFNIFISKIAELESRLARYESEGTEPLPADGDLTIQLHRILLTRVKEQDLGQSLRVCSILDHQHLD